MKRLAPTLAGALAPVLIGAFAAPPALAAPGVRCPFYGVDPGAPSAIDGATLEALAAAGAGAVRIELRLDGAADWDEERLVEYEALFDAALAVGLEPLGVLATDVVPGGQLAWNDDPDGDGINDYTAAFAAASALLVDRFAGRVARWEIWSQPNCWTNPDYVLQPESAGCSYVLPRVLATMLAEVYLQNRALAQTGGVSFTTGGLLTDESGPFFGGEDYLEELYAQPVWDELEPEIGRRYPWAHLGYQLYLDQTVATDGATLISYLDSAHTLAASYGDAAPFSITGVGWSSLLVSEEIQGQNLDTAFGLLAGRSDVADAFWAAYRDDPAADLYYGLVTEGGAEKPALASFQATAAGCEPTAGGEGGGGSGGGGTGSGSNPSGGSAGPPGSGTAPPLGGPREESACSCAAPGAGQPGGAAYIGAIVAGLAWAARRRRRVSA